MRLSLGIKACAWAIVGLLAAGTAWAQDGDGSIVVGVDLSADLVAVAGGCDHSLGIKGTSLGACCLPDGTCQDVASEEECTALAGQFNTSWANCGSDVDSDDVLDGCDDNCRLFNPGQEDCQPNGIGDVCDIAESTSQDNNGNGIPDECEQPPVALCQDVSIDADGNCEGDVAPEDVDNGSYDPDGGDVVLGLDPPGPYPLGTTTVTLTVTDDLGETDTCTATVTVVDTTPPSIDTEASDMTVKCDGAGNLDELGDWLESRGGAEASDACSKIKWRHGADAFSDDCGATSSTTVTFTATDACGLSSSTVATFTIADTTPPVIRCPADASVAWGDPTDPKATGWAMAADICDDDPAYPAITYSDVETPATCPADPLAYNIIRTWTATDECGNSESCVQRISVEAVYRPRKTMDTGLGDHSGWPSPLWR